MVKVKKNKAPKKGKKSKTTVLQKQTVNQHVKVNLYKPTRVPKGFKERQAPHNGTPNIRALPSFSFNSTVQQPASVLYGERFGNARTVQVSPFERMLADEAVDGNRALEVARLKNSLESSKLKKIQAEPILAPAKRGDSEENRFMDRAAESMEDYREPFRVSSVDEQGTLGVSFRSRLPAEALRQARLKYLEPTTIERSLQLAEEEALTGQPAVRGESETLRTDREPEEQISLGSSRAPNQYTWDDIIGSQQTYEEAPSHDQLGEPETPNRLTTYNAGLGADLLAEQRGEVVPQGQAEEYKPATPARRGRGAPIQFLDSAHRRDREYMREYRRRTKSSEH